MDCAVGPPAWTGLNFSSLLRPTSDHGNGLTSLWTATYAHLRGLALIFFVPSPTKGLVRPTSDHGNGLTGLWTALYAPLLGLVFVFHSAED